MKIKATIIYIEYTVCRIPVAVIPAFIVLVVFAEAVTKTSERNFPKSCMFKGLIVWNVMNGKINAVSKDKIMNALFRL